MTTAPLIPDSATRPPLVAAPPLIGNTVEMARDPAAFFLRCYRQ